MNLDRRMTAAIGVTVGLGALGLGIMATILTIVIQRVTIWFEHHGSRTGKNA